MPYQRPSCPGPREGWPVPPPVRHKEKGRAALSKLIPHSAAASFGTAQTGQVRMTEQAVGDAELEDQMLVCDGRP